MKKKTFSKKKINKMKRLITIFIAISIFGGIMFLKLSMIGCTQKKIEYSYPRTDDWHDGYREGHRDGRYIGYKLKEMESREKIGGEN